MDETSPTAFAEAVLKQLRAEQHLSGVSMKVLAQRSGLGQRTLARYIGPEADREPRLSDLIKIVDALGLDLETVLRRSRERER